METCPPKYWKCQPFLMKNFRIGIFGFDYRKKLVLKSSALKYRHFPSPTTVTGLEPQNV
jgi:hypothetical protein